jgi:hypothetical protein
MAFCHRLKSLAKWLESIVMFIRHKQFHFETRLRNQGMVYSVWLNRWNGRLQNRKALVMILLGILALNTILYLGADLVKYSSIQSRKDASGFSTHYGDRFVYFFYYTGHFPLATLSENPDYSREGAKREIGENGDELIMEYFHWARLGEHARIFAYMPDAWLKGSPQNPSIRLFNALVFTTGLMLLYIGFASAGLPLFGLILVLLISCTPFYMFEVFRNQNIFALSGSLFFIVLGINLPVMSGRARSFLLVCTGALVGGMLTGFFAEVRNEVVVVAASAVLMYLLAANLRIFYRLFLPVLFLLSLILTREAIQHFFTRQFEKTTQLVTEKGGHPYHGPVIPGHKFWHPVFCGLGDFDSKYGYKWSDKAAYAYAVPLLNQHYGMNIFYDNSTLHTNQYYDADSLYYIKFDELDPYNEIVRKKVLSDISADPFWYLGILIKRAVRILTVTLPVPYLGWFLIPLLWLLLKRRRWTYLTLLVVSLPLSATPLLIYSGRGSTYNSVFGYFIIIIFLLLLKEYPSRIAGKPPESAPGAAEVK